MVFLSKMADQSLAPVLLINITSQSCDYRGTAECGILAGLPSKTGNR